MVSACQHPPLKLILVSGETSNKHTMKHTPESIKQRSLTTFLNEASTKYDRGQAEHGGLLTSRKCLQEIKQEAIDLWHYAIAEEMRNEDREQYILELEAENYRLRGICDSFRVTAAVPV